MAYKTCPDCGCRIFKYGCVNCNEEDYITMQGAYDKPEYRASDKIKSNSEQNPERNVATEADHGTEAGKQKDI